MTQEHDVCVVTGCAGFVGSHLAERLLSMGHEVVGVDNLSTGRLKNMAAFAGHPMFHFHQRDINEPGLMDDLRTAHPGLNRVFHLAAIVSVFWSMTHEQETMETNWEATRRLHDQARDMGCKTFVFAGSAAEYGETDKLPIKESDADEHTVQLSPYGRAKYLSSRLMDSGGFGCSLRFFNIFGPRQDPKSPYSGVISIFIDRALAKADMTIFGDGNQTRDFIFVSDVVESYLLAAGMLDNEPLKGIYNVARGKETTILEMAERVRASTGADVRILFAPAREGDIVRSLSDPSRIMALGFAPEVKLDQGLVKTINFVRQDQD